MLCVTLECNSNNMFLAFQFRIFCSCNAKCPTSLSGGNSELEPPDPISNSEVKRFSADGSVGSPHVRVGHRQALNTEYPIRNGRVFFCLEKMPILY